MFIIRAVNEFYEAWHLIWVFIELFVFTLLFAVHYSVFTFVSFCYLFFLVEKLIETGKAILQKNDFIDLNDVR